MDETGDRWGDRGVSRTRCIKWRRQGRIQEWANRMEKTGAYLGIGESNGQDSGISSNTQTKWRT